MGMDQNHSSATRHCQSLALGGSWGKGGESAMNQPIFIPNSLQSSNVQVKVILSKIKSMQISHMFYNFVPGTKKGQS